MFKFFYETQDTKLFDFPNYTDFSGGEITVNENPSSDLLLLTDGSLKQESGESKTGFCRSLVPERNLILIMLLVRQNLYLPWLMGCVHSFVFLFLPVLRKQANSTCCLDW